MLAAAAEAAQGLAPNVSFRQGSSNALGPHLGRFRLVTMGRSFHWMDRADTLGRLERMIEAGGAIALFRDAHIDVPQNAWRKQWREITDRYASEDSVRERRRGGNCLPHETFLLASKFSRLGSLSLVAERVSTTESLIDRALSMSSVSRARIRERADRLVEELGALLAQVAPDRAASEVIEWSALIARRG